MSDLHTAQSSGKNRALLWFSALCMAVSWVATIVAAATGDGVHWWNWVNLISGSTLIASLFTGMHRPFTKIMILGAAIGSLVGLVGTVMH